MVLIFYAGRCFVHNWMSMAAFYVLFRPDERVWLRPLNLAWVSQICGFPRPFDRLFFLRVCSARVRLKVLLTFLLLLVCWWSQLCDLPSCAAAHALRLVCKAFARCRVSCLRFGGYLCTLTCSCSDHVNSSLGRKLNNIAMSRFVSAFLGGLCNVGMCVGVVVCVVFSMVWLCFPCQTLPCSATLCSTCLRLCSRTYRTMFLSFGWCVISPFRFF